MEPITSAVVQEAVEFTLRVFGWEDGKHVRHVWWKEQQTNHIRCAYCGAHPCDA